MGKNKVTGYVSQKSLDNFLEPCDKGLARELGLFKDKQSENQVKVSITIEK